MFPGPIKLHSKAATVYKRAMEEKYGRPRNRRAVGVCASGSEENARGHLVITAPTGGSAGVMPSIVYGLGGRRRKLSREKVREGMLAARDGLSLQTSCDAVCCRGWLPGRDRRGFSHGRGIGRHGCDANRGWSRTPRNRLLSITWA